MRKILELLDYNTLSNNKPFLILDEIHKYKNWKNYLKVFFDIYKNKINILVCGSAKLDIYKQGGDSLMGRYLLYRIHPFTIAELCSMKITDNIISAPSKLDNLKIDRLFRFGGYPEPFIKAKERFFNQWQRLRLQQLLQEDIV